MNTNFTTPTTPDLVTPTQLLRADQVADRLNISRALAYHLMKTGEIPTIRFKGSVRVTEADLKIFIESHKTS
jgi:excisionase family DNA binding protein